MFELRKNLKPYACKGKESLEEFAGRQHRLALEEAFEEDPEGAKKSYKALLLNKPGNRAGSLYQLLLDVQEEADTVFMIFRDKAEEWQIRCVIEMAEQSGYAVGYSQWPVTCSGNYLGNRRVVSLKDVSPRL